MDLSLVEEGQKTILVSHSEWLTPPKQQFSALSNFPRDDRIMVVLEGLLSQGDTLKNNESWVFLIAYAFYLILDLLCRRSCLECSEIKRKST
jgi:hypothetical protein